MSSITPPDPECDLTRWKYGGVGQAFRSNVNPYVPERHNHLLPPILIPLPQTSRCTSVCITHVGKAVIGIGRLVVHVIEKVDRQQEFLQDVLMYMLNLELCMFVKHRPDHIFRHLLFVSQSPELFWIEKRLQIWPHILSSLRRASSSHISTASLIPS
jgi:hypothetical protein